MRIRKGRARGALPRLGVSVCALIAALTCGCAAAARPPDAGRPRAGDQPPYPVLMPGDQERRTRALAEWARLTREQGILNAPAPELQPVTATLRSLPPLPGSGLYLPKVGEGTNVNEEDIRESLRRFISDAEQLIGATPQQLSLVQRTDAADGTKQARYLQRPFRRPLRGGYGVVEISFTPDRRILQLDSTCIPDLDKLQRPSGGIAPRITADDVPKHLAGRSISYVDPAGRRQDYTITASDNIDVRELVVYPRLRTGATTEIEFHLAWEVLVGRAPAHTVYLDAVTDEILAPT